MLSAYYNAGDIYVYTGVSSITLREAMACGLPLVIPNHGRELGLAKYNNCLVYEAENIFDFIENIKALLDNQKLLLTLSQNSIKAVREHLSYKIIARHHENNYKQLLDKYS